MGTFADKVRTVFRDLGNNEAKIVTAKDAAAALGLTSYAEKQPLYATISDMKARGELRRAGKNGAYYVVSDAPVNTLRIRTVMWRLLRARKKVTVEELRELAGASESYAVEWLKMLVKRGVVKKMSADSYHLIEDPVDEPINTDRIERLRTWRQQKKQALSALNKAAEAIEEAKTALNEKKRPGDVPAS